MANGNADSDTKLKLNSSVLTTACSSWNSTISSVGLSSIDVNSTFSALMDCGVGTSFFPSLSASLKSLDTLTTSISSLISTTVSQQEETDNKAAEEASNNTYGNSTYDRTSSGGAAAVETVNKTDTGDYDVDNKKNDVSIKEDNKTDSVELDTIEQNELAAALSSIYDEDTPTNWATAEDASVVKEQLLESPNISDDVKEKIAEMDENEVQTTLTNILSSGDTVSDFSKTVISVFDNDLKNNFKNATIYDSADSIAKVFNYISKEKNAQQALKELYFGTSIIDKVDDNVVTFARSFVDLMATANNVSYEDILNDSKYQEDLIEEMEDISKSFFALSTAKDSGVSSELYSNVIIGA